MKHEQKYKYMRYKYMTPAEAADYLRLSLGSFYNYVSLGKIPYRINKATGSKKYLKKDLDSLFVKPSELEL